MGETRQQPRIVIGSSWESRALADALRDSLLYTAEVSLRHQGFYPLSSDATDRLLLDLATADFAVFLLSAEDVTLMRDEGLTVIRDNLLLQMGIALGTIGRSRVFFVSPRSLFRDAPEFSVPADALGVIAATFCLNHRGDDPASALGVASAEIRREVLRLGPRLRDTAPVAAAEDTPAFDTDAAGQSSPAPQPSRPRIRIRFDLNPKGPETSREEQLFVLKGWWDTLSERERRTIIRFGEVDERLNLRRGMTRAHLHGIAEADGYGVDHEGESLIIFHRSRLPRPRLLTRKRPGSREGYTGKGESEWLYRKRRKTSATSYPRSGSGSMTGQ